MVYWLGKYVLEENAISSCQSLKKAGHFKSMIYGLKSSNDKYTKLAYCDMNDPNGYKDAD